MADKESNKESNSIVKWFCVIIIITLCIYVGYSCYTARILKQSQERIVREHVSHIARVDSIFYGMKEVILSSDSGVIANAPILLSQLQQDSALFRREVLLSQEELSNLTELHLNKIDGNYDQINMWFGVAGIIFLILGFYGIFKIEESKKHAEELVDEFREEVQQKTKDVLIDLQSKATPIQNVLADFTSKNDQFDQLVKNSQAQLDLLNQQCLSAIERATALEEQLQKDIAEVKNLKTVIESLV